MTYVARVILGDESDGRAYDVIGRGTTPEEATKEVMRQVGVEILVELEKDVLISSGELDKMPKELPPGKSLVIFARHSHNHGGGPYSHRYFAISPGNFTVDRKNIAVIDGRVAMVNTMDSNSDALYRLPKGSMEYKDDQWVQSAGVDYNY